MLKVLLVGHVCAPDMGSEPGVTWRWASHLAAHNEVWLICHPQYRARTEAFLERHPVANLHFHYVDLPAWRNPWNPDRGARGLRVHYLLWQREVLKVALELHKQVGFDVAHQVSWTTITAPTPLWKMPIPSLWGPVGGAITAPVEFLDYFGQDKTKEKIRTLRVRLLAHSPWIRKAARALSVCFATNRETMAFLRGAGARDVRFLIDQGLLEDDYVEAAPRLQMGARLELAWAGRLEYRKALPLLLEALALLPKDFPVRVRVAGEGPLEADWKALAHRLGVSDRVEFIGFIDSAAMRELFVDSHALVFCSLRDAFGTVATEAMTLGRPIVTLDHQGIGSAVPESAAVKVPVTTPQETVRAFAEAIRQVADPARLDRLSRGASAYIRQHGWRERALEMTECYRELCAPKPTASIGGPRTGTRERAALREV